MLSQVTLDAPEDGALAEERLAAAAALLKAAREASEQADRGMTRSIQAAARHGMSKRRIAEITGIDRGTVGRLLERLAADAAGDA